MERQSLARCSYGKGETNHQSNMMIIPVENHKKCVQSLREKLYQQRRIKEVNAAKQMQKQNQCPVCYQNFDPQQHIPMLVCTNQHNVCQLCVFNIKDKCPLCTRSFNPSEIYPNRYLIKTFQLLTNFQKQVLENLNEIFRQINTYKIKELLILQKNLSLLDLKKCLSQQVGKIVGSSLKMINSTNMNYKIRKALEYTVKRRQI